MLLQKFAQAITTLSIIVGTRYAKISLLGQIFSIDEIFNLFNIESDLHVTYMHYITYLLHTWIALYVSNCLHPLTIFYYMAKTKDWPHLGSDPTIRGKREVRHAQHRARPFWTLWHSLQLKNQIAHSALALLISMFQFIHCATRIIQYMTTAYNKTAVFCVSWICIPGVDVILELSTGPSELTDSLAINCDSKNNIHWQQQAKYQVRFNHPLLLSELSV